MTVPPRGAYWTSHAPPTDLDLPTMRQGGTSKFDNAEWRVWKVWEHYKGMILPEYEWLIEDSGVGRPPLQHVGSNPSRLASVGSIEYAAMVSHFLPHWQGVQALEIGGGYGGLAWATLRAAPRLIGYTIVDLPEVARCSRYYLKEFGERAWATDSTWLTYTGRTFDLIIQTRGFMEMSPQEVAWYFGLIQGGMLIEGGLFFFINRWEKVTRFPEDYPFDRRWEVLLGDIWPEGEGMPMLLLRRTSEESDALAETIEALRGMR